MAIRNNTFILKRSNVVNKIPVLSGLTLGELALNTADAKLYTLYTGGLTGATEVREIGWNRLSISGGTLYGNLNVLGAITATTYYGNGSNLTGINDFYVTGATFLNGILTLNRQNGSVTVSGFSSTDIFTTGFTYSNNTLSILRNQGQAPLTITINNFTGLTVNGPFSASTYLGLPVSSDNFVTGGTFSNNILTLDRQNGSVVITGFTDYFVTGGTYNPLTSTLTFNRQNGSFTVTGITTNDFYVTGFTYDNANNLTILQNNGSYTVNISVMTGLTVNGDLTVTSDLTTTNLHTQYVFDKNDNPGTPGQFLINTATGIEWVDGDSFCNLKNTTTNDLEFKLIDVISGFTAGSYIVKSYVTAFSGSSKYGFWERTLGVVTTGTTGSTPIVTIITQDFDKYSSGFVPSQIVYTPNNNNSVEVYVSGLTSESLYWESYYDIIGQNCRPVISVTPSANLGSFGININNGSSTITTGHKGYLKIPYPGTITSWTIMSDLSGSIAIDIWKDTIASFPPTIADSITNGNYPNLSSQLINTSNVLSGWTTTNFLADDIFAFNVLSATSVTNINLTINVIKT